MFYVPDSLLDGLIEEDLHMQDLTTAALGIGDRPGRVECAPKSGCVLAGVEEAARMFERLGARAEVLLDSGSEVEAGACCLRAYGGAARLHAVYKAAQNVMEYASGIATRSAEMVRNARSASPRVAVCVTRKHFPGTKRISVKAALAGGASVHRFGLSDSILIFDQHRVFLDEEAFAARLAEVAAANPERRIMVEAGTPEEALRFARAGVGVVQCERFPPQELAACVVSLRALDPGIRVSAAGGVNAENAAAYAATGVDALVTSWVYFGRPVDIKMRFFADA